MSEQTAGVKFPPPLVFLAAIVIGGAVDRYVYAAPMGLAAPMRYWLGGGVALIGFALMLWAAGLFRAAGTPPAPWKPSTAFVATGPYRFTRNPMYLGMSLMLIGAALAANSWLILVLLLPALLIIQIAVIAKEEHYLEVKFGQTYRDYKARVRRWI